VKQISTIGLDLAKNVFQIHGATRGRADLQSETASSEVLRFFEKLPRVWSDWRRAAVRIIGRARSRRSVTTCA